MACWSCKEDRVRRCAGYLRDVIGLKRHLTFGLIGGFIGMAAPQYVQYAIDHAVLNRDAGGLGRLFLQGQMQAFMTTNILGVTQLGALDLNAKAQPPNREL